MLKLEEYFACAVGNYEVYYAINPSSAIKEKNFFDLLENILKDSDAKK